jgi:hypothetical protein
MQKRIPGCTGLEVSILGLSGFHLVETAAAEARTLLNRYLDAGGVRLCRLLSPLPRSLPCPGGAIRGDGSSGQQAPIRASSAGYKHHLG